MNQTAVKLLMRNMGIDPDKIEAQLTDTLKPLAERLQRIEEKLDAVLSILRESNIVAEQLCKHGLSMDAVCEACEEETKNYARGGTNADRIH